MGLIWWMFENREEVRVVMEIEGNKELSKPVNTTKRKPNLK